IKHGFNQRGPQLPESARNQSNEHTRELHGDSYQLQQTPCPYAASSHLQWYEPKNSASDPRKLLSGHQGFPSRPIGAPTTTALLASEHQTTLLGLPSRRAPKSNWRSHSTLR